MGGFAFRGIDRQLTFSHRQCAQGPRDAMKSVHECIFRRERDLKTLVCARGVKLSLKSGSDLYRQVNADIRPFKTGLWCRP